VVKSFVNGSLPPVDTPEREKAFEWLRKNGHGDIIKTRVTVHIARGQDDDAIALSAFLQEGGYDWQAESGVHYSTLKAWLREQIEKHKTTPPLKLFNVFLGRVAELCKPKKR
jgi:hypothetical protein